MSKVRIEIPEELYEKMLRKLAAFNCPSDYGLPTDCDRHFRTAKGCFRCWNVALKPIREAQNQ
jgi:hypothetical protein